MKTRETILAVK